MLHTRVIVSGHNDCGNGQILFSNAQFRDPEDIARVTAELTSKIQPLYPHIVVMTREAN